MRPRHRLKEGAALPTCTLEQSATYRLLPKSANDDVDAHASVRSAHARYATGPSVAAVVDGRPVVLRSDEGAAVTPSTVSFLGSTARVGGSIINLRVVQPQDKSASLIILISALSLFSLFPSPIVFGALLGL